jgi:hypothetical protein
MPNKIRNLRIRFGMNVKIESKQEKEQGNLELDNPKIKSH